MNLFNTGLRPDMSAYLQEKIWLNNQVAFMCAIIGFAYFPFLYVHYQLISIYPFTLFIISSFVIVMARMGYFQQARFLNSFQMLTFATFFQASIIQADEPFLISFFCAQLAMTLIPWVLYGFQEKKQLIASLFICYGLLASQQLLNELIVAPVDVTFFRESYLNPMTYISAVAIQITLLLLMKTKKQPIAATATTPVKIVSRKIAKPELVS